MPAPAVAATVASVLPLIVELFGAMKGATGVSKARNVMLGFRDFSKATAGTKLVIPKGYSRSRIAKALGLNAGATDDEIHSALAMMQGMDDAQVLEAIEFAADPQKMYDYHLNDILTRVGMSDPKATRVGMWGVGRARKEHASNALSGLESASAGARTTSESAAFNKAMHNVRSVAGAPGRTMAAMHNLNLAAMPAFMAMPFLPMMHGGGGGPEPSEAEIAQLLAAGGGMGGGMGGDMGGGGGGSDLEALRNMAREGNAQVSQATHSYRPQWGALSQETYGLMGDQGPALARASQRRNDLTAMLAQQGLI